MPATVAGIHLGPDTHANRPAANAAGLPVGALYLCSDHNLIYITSGSAWSTWASLSGTGIPATLLDAKGDLIAASAADTAAKLTVGANDTILMADSGQTTGIKWVASQTPSTQAFGDSAAEGTADTYARGDHKHAMPATPGGLGCCVVYHSTTQSRASGSAVVFNSEVSDAGGWHDTGSNTSRIVVPATGVYLLMGAGFTDANPGTGPLFFKIDNTTNVIGSGQSMIQAAAYQQTQGVAAISASSYVELIYGANNTVNFGHASVNDARAMFAVIRVL